MNKKLLITLIVIIIAVPTAFFGYRYYQSNNSPDANSQVPEVKDTSTINPWYVTDGQAISPALSLDGLSVWYFDGVSRELMRQNLQDANDLKKYPLSENKDIRFALWPNKGSDFIIGGADGYKAYYNSAADKYIDYPKNIRWVSWMPDGVQVAYIWSGDAGASLAVAKSDNSEYKTVTKLSNPDYRVAVSPNGKTFALYSGNGKEPLSIVIDGLNVLLPLTEAATILNAQFSTDNKTLAFVEQLNGKNYLKTIDIGTKAVTTRGFVKQPSAFTWSADGAHLYFADNDNVLNKLDVVTNQARVINAGQVTVPVSGIFLTPDSKQLFLIEAGGTGRLVRILLQ